MANPLLDLDLIRTMALDKNEQGYYRILSQVEIEYVTPEEVEAEVRQTYDLFARRPATTPVAKYVWSLLQKAMNNSGTAIT